MPDRESNNRDIFGIEGDYMTAGVGAPEGIMSNLSDPESPQGIPGRDNPPEPWDDQGEGKSLAEMLKEKVQSMFSRK